MSGAEEVPSTSACGAGGESSRPTTDDSEPEPETHRRRCENHHRRPEVASAATASAGVVGGGEYGGGSGRGGRSSKGSTLESDVRDVRRILQAYALRLSERDAHARVTKQWPPGPTQPGRPSVG